MNSRDYKSWRSDFGKAQRCSDALNKYSFAGAQWAVKKDQIASAKLGTYFLAQVKHLLGGCDLHSRRIVDERILKMQKGPEFPRGPFVMND